MYPDGSEDSPEMQQMRDLLGEDGGIKSVKSGDIVEGVVMEVSDNGILVNIGHKSEGLVPQREMRTLTPEALSLLKIGDSVLTSVVRPDTEEEPAILSLDRARREQGWLVLERFRENDEAFEAIVSGVNRGGILVLAEGIEGFIPISQLDSLPRELTHDNRDDALNTLVGKTLSLRVVELDRQRNRAIFSERLANQVQRNRNKQELLNVLTEGEIRQGKVTGISPFGAFVDLGGADGLIHISELSWTSVDKVEEILTIGDVIDVYVLRVDHENSRIALSLKRLTPGPWDTIEERYYDGQIVTGTITKLALFGAFARIDDSLEGLIHISELSENPVQHPKEVVKEGDILTLKIIRIERERHRLALSLKQANEEY